MGTINVLGKWDLEKGIWVNGNMMNAGRSFAIADYNPIINDNGKINYIIIDQGSRVENHFRDFVNIKEREVRIDNVISYFESHNDNYQIKLFLMDADAPIIEDAKLFARYIQSLALLTDTNLVNVIGLSKCGVMNFYVPRFFNNPQAFDKVNIYNIATPYTGTKMASPLVFYSEIRSYISSIFGDNALSSTISDMVIKLYKSISSNSHMDYDIAISGGISDDLLYCYDENFIKNVFCDDNVEAINKLNSFKNFSTEIDDDVIREAIRTFNLEGLALCMLDRIFFQGKSDGMVYTESQKQVERYLDVKSIMLKSHHDVNSNTRAFNEVLGVLDDTILEFNDRNKVLKKMY